ncbi:conjugal transfer protein [Sporolactobacillus terrae]|uniref:Conjugal transfer protein n=1 Tax=Sporolactobacillus terrae TaxID=269673 RepID=A0A5K7X203_9BACL|nr:conjugal transfer protein [Sporolactobacillus terrae]BBO00035.1 conjugal transfer protein [Sporolactobacillus terrae]
MIYAINDFQLPFPVNFTQMSWFVCSLLLVVLFANVPPLSLIHGALLKYVGLPVGLTWFMSQKTFDKKNPYGFLKSVITYLLRPKVTYAGKSVKLKKEFVDESITAVRGEQNDVPDQVH